MKYLFFTAVLFSFAFIVAACEDGNQPPSAPATVAEKKHTYGEKGALNTWPGESDGLEISKALTAKNYYLIVDGSGSMLEVACSNGAAKISVAKSSLARFIDKIPQGDNIGLYAFDSRGMGEYVALASRQRNNVKNALQEIKPGRSTPLHVAVNAGRNALSQQGKRQLGYGEYHLVIVTDGAASDRKKLRAEVDSLLESTPIVVHTIGFCIESRHTLNQPDYVIYRAADNPQMLEEGLELVLAEAESFDIVDFEDN